MKYALDSSVALKWGLAEPDSSKAEQLRDEFRGAVHDLLAPDFFPLEVAHALTKAERQLRIPPPMGERCQLLTADARLISTFRHQYPFIVDLAELP